MNDVAQVSPWGRMNAQEYMQERVDDQLDWYGKKSTQNKQWFHRLQLLMLIAALSIPVLSLISGDMSMRIFIAFVGALTAIAAGAMSLCRFRDLWVDYRATAEILKNEKYLFMTGSFPYTTDDSFPVFVARVESIILQENKGWQQKKLEINTQEDTTLSDTEIGQSKDGSVPDS